MVLFNHATREMTAKIVYYGPGLCGKTTNLMVIFEKLDPKKKGKMLSLATKTDRTLFFDLLPVDIGRLGSFNLKIQLYTVPGQVFYNETRKLVLKGADAVVFVADSQAAMVDATRESFQNLLENLEENNIDPNSIPIVVQYNKRDLPGVLPVEELQEALGLDGYPYAEASAIKGEGVMETFKLVSKIAAKHLLERMKGPRSEPAARKAGETKPPPAAKKAAGDQAHPAPAAPEPALPFDNPFASGDPFPDSGPARPDEGYERMEEVSLESLLEGRERPLTMTGTIAVPIEEIEELDAGQLMPVDEPLIAAEVIADGAPAASAAPPGPRALEEEVERLKGRIAGMKDEQRAALQSILEDLDALAGRVRKQLGA